MFTPERKCDVRQLDAQAYAVCVSEQEKGKRASEACGYEAAKLAYIRRFRDKRR